MKPCGYGQFGQIEMGGMFTLMKMRQISLLSELRDKQSSAREALNPRRIGLGCAGLNLRAALRGDL